MIGKKIRELRKKNQLPISELAAKVGVSDSYISQLERNIVDPSVSVLRKISNALGVPIASFFDEIYDAPVVIRQEERKDHPFSRDGLKLICLSPSLSDGNSRMEAEQFELFPKNREMMLKQSGETCIHLLQGIVEITVKDQCYRLNAGDSLYLSARIPYLFYNPGPNQAKGILCSTGDFIKEGFL